MSIFHLWRWNDSDVLFSFICSFIRFSFFLHKIHQFPHYFFLEKKKCMLDKKIFFSLFIQFLLRHLTSRKNKWTEKSEDQEQKDKKAEKKENFYRFPQTQLHKGKCREWFHYVLITFVLFNMIILISTHMLYCLQSR